VKLDKINHPTDDPKLPSYHHPTLVDVEGDLKRAWACWQYLRGVKADYLPKEPAEPNDAYQARLDRAVYAGFFRDSIESFAGILSRFQLRNPPATMEQYWADINAEGDDGRTFLMTADAMLMRDGGVCLGVEMSPEGAQSRAEELNTGKRPYLVTRARNVMLNWQVGMFSGIEIPILATFLEVEEINDPDGFGVRHEPRYRVIRPGEWTLYKLVEQKGNGGGFRAQEIDAGQYLQPNGQPLPVCPIIWYSIDGDQFGTGGMPLRQVMELDLEHFRMRSDLNEKRHRISMPVPVREGVPQPPPGMPPERLVLGPNSVVDVPLGGGFHFAEPLATSLKDQMDGIAHVEAMIRQKTMSFAYSSDGAAAKTATQVSLEAANVKNSITKMAARKESAMQRLMWIWCLFTGEQLSPEAGINMANSIYDRPLNPQERVQLIAEVDAGLVSRETAIEMLQRGGVNDITQSVDEELGRIRADERRAASRIGTNDPESTGDRQPPAKVPDNAAPGDIANVL
jgi:hypothetical protein